MSPNAMIVLTVIGLVVMIIVIRFVISAAVNKGADAIMNKVSENKNKKIEESGGGRKRLADRYVLKADTQKVEEKTW